jgi:D-alanyl-D-alanine carboxypeptidase (penicillin-binding protein 5/6)
VFHVRHLHRFAAAAAAFTLAAGAAAVGAPASGAAPASPADAGSAAFTSSAAFTDPAADPAAAAAPALSVEAQPAPESSETPVYDPGPLTDGSAPPQLPAESWILVDLETGEVLTEHEPDLPHAPASTIKLLSALALVDELDDPEAKQEAVYEDMRVDGTKVGLVQKNDYTIDDLFHALLMSSANDAAHALGEAVGGQERAVELMTDKAAELGLTGTVPKDTSGLNDTSQVTTVSDLIRVGRAVLGQDYLMDVIGTTEYSFPGAVNPDTDEKLKGFPIQNHTRVVGEVEGGLGLKNGYTSKAGGSFVAVVERDGRQLASAVLGSQGSTREGAVDLLEWGFAQSSPEAVDSIELRTPAEIEEEEAASAAAERSSAPPERPVQADAEAADADLASSAPAWLGPAGLGAALVLLIALAVLLRRRAAARRRAPRH